MDFLDVLSLGTFCIISILFFLIGSRPVLFHLICATLLGIFVSWSGKRLNPDSIGEWVIVTAGLMLYWFGLVIVRIMLTRSVSLQMLAAYARGEHRIVAAEGIAGRLKDASHFGLVRRAGDAYTLTPFGKSIALIVESTYFLLRLK